LSRFNKENLNRTISYLSRNGFRKTLYKMLERLSRDGDEADYDSQMRSNQISEDERTAQKSVEFIHPYKISILVPLYETDMDLLEQMLESVALQTYGNWELCLCDASATDGRRIIVHRFCEKWNLKCTDNFGNVYDKVKYEHIDTNGGISANTNEALKMATGDYIALLDHDDVIEPNALFEFMKATEEYEISNRERDGSLTKALIVYTDEDKMSFDSGHYFDYHKKPDFDPVLLRTNNYICHFLFVETALARSVDGFHSEFDGAQDHDFVLRCTEEVSADRILHIDKVLYHWRSTPVSTAEHPTAKMYAYDAGKRAVAEHLRRIGIKGEVLDTDHLGFYKIRYKDSSDEVLTISREKYLTQSSFQISILAQEYLMIISNSIRPLSSDCISQMLSCMQNQDIGAVTGKIIAKNGRVESAGYDKKSNGEQCARFAGLKRYYSGYLHRANLQQLVDGFSQDVVLVRKKAIKCYEPDIILKDGYRVFYNPEAEFKRKRL